MGAVLRKTLYALTACLYIVSGTGMADDTEIYFGGTAPDPDNVVLPNVLFVLDTSSSMNSIVPGTGKTRLQNMKDALVTVIGAANNVNVGLMRFSRDGGPVLFPIANIEADVTDVEGTNDPSVLVRVNQGSDDAEEDQGGGAVNLTSTDLELVNDPATGSGDQTVGVRFQKVLIPQGVTITQAHLLFTVDEIDSGPTDVTIRGELSDDAQTFTTTSGSISSRPQTSEFMDWSIPSWDNVDDVHQSPPLTAIVQEIVDQGPVGGWCGGNAMAFVITGSGARHAESYNGETDSAPQLFVEWNPASVPLPPGGCIAQSAQAQVKASVDDAEERPDGSMYLTSSDLELVDDGGDQLVGMRFQNLNVPAGATILNAEIEFEIDSFHSTSISLRVHGEDPAGGSLSFTSTDDDITNRTLISPSVMWGSLAAPAVNEKLVTPDLSSIVQNIVDGVWTSGDDMVFVVEHQSGTGKRETESYDGEAGAAPILRIDYESTAGGGSPVMTVRDRLIEIVEDIQYKSGTPIVDTLYEGALYYRGEDVDYGKQRGNSGFSRREFTRVSHDASYTGGSHTLPAGCTESNLNDTNCIPEVITGTATYVSPIEHECQGNYMVLLSDGQPSTNSAVSKVEAMIGASCANPADSDAKCGNELVEFLHTVDQIDDATIDDDQTILTHTIGFNLAGDPAYLVDLATAGGGNFYSATTAADLVDVFESILGEILEAPTSFAAPSLSVNAFNKLFNLDSVYFALFEPSDSQAWLGNLKKYQICSDPAGQGCVLGEVLDANGDPAIGADFKIKSDAQSFWSASPDGPDVVEGGAGSKIPTHGSRTVYTYDGADFPGAPQTMLAVTTANITEPMVNAASPAERDDIVGWLRGQDVQDEDGDFDTSEDRWAFADPLHSRPITIVYGAELDGGGNPDPDKPIIKILVGTNDGGVRLINESDGSEEWIFYPKEALLNAKNLMNDTTGPKLYGADGTPTVLIVDNDGDGVIEPGDGDEVKLFFGQRRGGNNLYGLDLTPASTLTTQATGQVTPEFMWHILGGTGEYDHLGDTWSAPLVTNIRTGIGGAESTITTALIIGGGYDNTHDSAFAAPTGFGNAVYIIDANDGSRIFWASSDINADLVVPEMTYPIPADIALLDANGDFETDRLYTVDTAGQVFRIDLDSTLTAGSPGNTGGGVLAQISVAGPPADDERRMYYTVDVAEVLDQEFSDVAAYDAVAVGTGFRAHPNDIDVHDRIYVLRDYLFDTPVDATSSNYPICNDGAGGFNGCGGTPMTEADLVDLTGNEAQQGVPAVITQLQDSNGWYIVLQETDGSFVGEKVLAEAIIIDNILFVTTFTPASAGGGGPDPCAANEGTGKVFALNLFNAGAAIDFSGDGTLEVGDRVSSVGGGVPSQVVPVFQDGGITLLIGSGGGAASVDPGIGLPRNKSDWAQER